MIHAAWFIFLFAHSALAESTFCGLKVPPGIERSFNDWTRSLNCPSCKEAKTACPLNEIKNPPKIILVGENHSDKNSAYVRNQLFEMSGKGQFHIATEVREGSYALPWTALPSKNIHGIESPVPTAIFASYLIQQSNVENDDPAWIFSTLTLNIDATPLLRGAYNAMAARGQCPECLKKIDEAIKLSANSSNPRKIITPEKFASLVKSVPEKELREFLTQLHIEAIDIANTKFSEKFDKLEYLKSTDDLNKVGLYNKARPNEKQNTTTDFAFRNVRNRDFVYKISELLCWSEFKSDPLVVIVGDAHVEGIQEMLSGLSDKKIEMKYFKSYDAAEGANLLLEAQK